MQRVESNIFNSFLVITSVNLKSVQTNEEEQGLRDALKVLKV